jgi:5-oxopent-3-ene-1,2,5-tricarboxylate decarboxylase / 2-hydroxyhepta-2,4-diene-1,7-dioate isomerase
MKADTSNLVGRIRKSGEDIWITPSATSTGMLEILTGNFDAGFIRTGQLLAEADAEFLIPFLPGKLLGIGKNYPIAGEKSDPHPAFFLMAHNALLAHGQSLVLRPRIGGVIPEGELAVIIGKTLRNVSPSEVNDNILGYTICNDFSARETDPPETNAVVRKSSDGLLPVGPYILLSNTLRIFNIETYKNGVLCQSGATSQMIHSIPSVISFISQFMTLERFDLIATGTPGPKAIANRGDLIEVKIPGIGTLRTEIT